MKKIVPELVMLLGFYVAFSLWIEYRIPEEDLDNDSDDDNDNEVLKTNEDNTDNEDDIFTS